MDEFEQLLKRQPMRRVPSHWRRELLQAARPEPVAHERWDWRAWLFRVAMPATALVVVVWVIFTYFPAKPGPPQDVAVTEEMPGGRIFEEKQVLGARKLGVYEAPDGRLYRVVQCVGATRWVREDAAGQKHVEKIVPQQRVVLVSMKSY